METGERGEKEIVDSLFEGYSGPYRALFDEATDLAAHVLILNGVLGHKEPPQEKQFPKLAEKWLAHFSRVFMYPSSKLGPTLQDKVVHAAKSGDKRDVVKSTNLSASAATAPTEDSGAAANAAAPPAKKLKFGKKPAA